MTKSIKVVSFRERFARLTVWHPINTDPEDENRWGPRFWFPTYDVIALILGLYAFFQGSPLLNRMFPVWFTDSLGVALITSSLVCLVGVCFPRLNYLELLGKMAIVFILGGYAGTIAFLSKTNDPNGFVVVALLMSVWLLGPRISVLFVQVTKNSSLSWLFRGSRRKGT